ncbi:MAG: hypothetical protein JWQ44_1156 [Chthoniobacter sp.]|nr:hypothetical protein [Chthoniobacter sp.]
MTISFAATNPCHVFPLAQELARTGALGCYYSGYPRWKLAPAPAMKVRAHSLRTNVVYGLLKYVPEGWRPSSRRLFLWQDRGFDRWVSGNLSQCDFIHGLPGQCLQTFRAARRRGIATVLNHATGPVRQWVKIMEPEYARVGLKLSEVCPYDDAYFAREEEEYAHADWHCAASTVVRDQLVGEGIDTSRIWVVPYGADPQIFAPENATTSHTFRIAFAGQIGVRKGLKTFLEALTQCARTDWQVDLYGARLGEADADLAAYQCVTPLRFHGAVSQSRLAEAFRSASVLVLPSLEEGFGLVVPQALNCGTPVIVSDRVGGKDLVRHRENGSIFPVSDVAALASELQWWSEHPRRLSESFTWDAPAQKLLEHSRASLS